MFKKLNSFLLLAILTASWSAAGFAQTLRIPPSTVAPPPASGEVGFTDDDYQAAEDVGVTTVEVSRVDAVGSCTLAMDTSDGTAIAGVDYVAVVNSFIIFGDGTSGFVNKSITILARPGVAQGNLTINVTLTKNTCPNDTLVNPTEIVLIIDQDVDNSFPVGWTQPSTLIDGTGRTVNDSSTAYETATDRFSIFHDGGEIFSTADHFKPVCWPIASLGDATIITTVVQSHPGTLASFPKAGIMARDASVGSCASSPANAINIYANILGEDGAQGYNLSQRDTPGGTTTKTDFTSPAVSLSWGLKLELDGALDSFRTFYATNPASPSWVEYAAGNKAFLSTGDAIDIMLAATVNDSADAGFTGTAIFADTTVDVATSVDHSSTAIANYLPVNVPPVNEDAGTVTLRMTRAGGLSGALTIDFATAAGTCVAGTHYTETSGAFSWTDGVGGEDTATVPVIDIVGAQGAASCTFTADSTVSTGSATIINGTATVTWIDTDQTPPQTGAWSTQGASSCSDGLGSFDAFIPGMRGQGSCNRGGFVTDTTVLRVSNLNASGAGSLVAALAASCPKVILFDVSGLINLSGNSGITTQRCDDWSLVGASAPSNITLTGSVNTLLNGTGSNWTIDHMTLAAGDTDITAGNTGNRDSLAFEQNTDGGNVTILNNNLIWGADETTQCYMGGGDGTKNFNDVLHWQNIIGYPVGGSGVHIIQNTCRTNASIRNFYIHANGRMPLVRADGYFHANNFTANYGYNASQFTPCGGFYAPVDDPVRMQSVDNFYVRGPNSGGREILYVKDASCTTFNLHEQNNRKMNADQTIVNCDNNACVEVVTGSVNFVSQISAVYPTGYVPETIVNDAAGLLDFANQVTAFVGARPSSRLAYMTTTISEGINMVDGVGDVGGWLPGSGFPSSGFTGTTVEGGISVITPSGPTTWDPTDVADNGFANMPIGATANNIQTSGLTKLHEWVICAFYDSIMPSGYREDDLEDCTAP